MALIKPSLARLYSNATDEEVRRAMKASTALLRLRDVIEENLRIPMSSPMQWAERRAEDNHSYATTPLFPVGALSSGLSAELSDEFLPGVSSKGLEELKAYNFGIILAANSSGGFNKDEMSKYLFSIDPVEETRDSFYRTEDALLQKYSSSEAPLKTIGGTVCDYVVLEGYDQTTSLRVLVELGNKPQMKRVPRGCWGVKKDFGLVPKTAVNLDAEIKSSLWGF